MYFIGTSEHSIDAKNRLAIPSKFRARMDPDLDGKDFVIVRGRPPDRLWLYPERYFEALVSGARSALIPDGDQMQFDQLYFPAAELAELDGQGRILIPDRMLRRAGLGREVLICGVRDHLEIRRRESADSEPAEGWGLCQEIEDKARAAYDNVVRQPGPKAG
jgi:MraZ protein